MEQKFTEQKFTKPFEWILDDRYRWGFHALFWLFVYLDEFLSIFGVTPSYETPSFVLIEIFADVFIVYLNLYVLVPFFLLENRLVEYIGLTLLSLLMNGLLMMYMFSDFSNEYALIFADLIGVLLTTASILGTAIGIKIFKFFIKKQREVVELKSANLETELTFLKDQINPHFLFNALNNIYVQARKKSPEVPESILLLSDLLRYQLYDCSKNQVLLRNEIDYLKNYLKLDEMRKTGTKIQFNLTGHPNGVQIAPFIFLPFIENAVKYSNTREGAAFINVDLDIQPETIQFNISNSYDNHDIAHQGGIGHANVQRRLELLYPEKHELRISDKDNVFTVRLKLDIR